MLGSFFDIPIFTYLHACLNKSFGFGGKKMFLFTWNWVGSKGSASWSRAACSPSSLRPCPGTRGWVCVAGSGRPAAGCPQGWRRTGAWPWRAGSPSSAEYRQHSTKQYTGPAKPIRSIYSYTRISHLRHKCLSDRIFHGPTTLYIITCKIYMQKHKERYKACSVFFTWNILFNMIYIT